MNDYGSAPANQAQETLPTKVFFRVRFCLECAEGAGLPCAMVLEKGAFCLFRVDIHTCRTVLKVWHSSRNVEQAHATESTHPVNVFAAKGNGIRTNSRKILLQRSSTSFAQTSHEKNNPPELLGRTLLHSPVQGSRSPRRNSIFPSKQAHRYFRCLCITVSLGNNSATVSAPPQKSWN